MRYAPRAILAGGLGFAVSCVVACGGGSGLLSGDQSSAIGGQLGQVSAAVQSGNCGAASSASQVLGNDVQNLPVTVNPTLRSNLSQGVATVAELAQKDCRQNATSTTTPTTSSTVTSTTTPTTTTKTTTSTATSTSTTSTTNTSATTPPDTGTTSTTTGGAGLGGTTSTGTDTGTTGTTGGTGPGDNGNGNSNGNGSGGG
jgi:hypothetical protein